ncbi:poly(A) RNA polymerase GLD2 [Paramormyrops kingsleyae]|uniref:polynucleotide adenylyltransferase n=1 Tax=Paramormyrops kingsleyae TaxID=1676925 RepID=A0A3B3TBG4_9TELE|nr:poly(A) RNA polymerase GLD2 isoform X1 [Paramormyrops kingsleyae]
MFPHSSILGCPPFPPKPGQANGLLSLPVVFAQQQMTASPFNNRNNLSPFPLNRHYDWKPALHTASHALSVPPVRMSRKRRSGDYGLYDLKRQRFSSPGCHERTSRVATPSPTPRSIGAHLRSESCGPSVSPLRSQQAGYVPAPTGKPCHSTPDSFQAAATDKLSQQIMDLFQACQQQTDDLEKKELCRTQLQREIQRLFPYSRLFLAGSSLNGFGSRSSDADLCLVVKEGNVNQRTDAVYILSLVQKLLYKLSYIDRPQLIRAKVPILKFRDKFSGLEFDLNVNNIVGIRNTFLLRSYAYTECRVRPVVLVIKKWAQHHGINDASRGTLSSYTLVLMVLHYLQTLSEPVIPCLQKDYPECFNPSMEIHLVPEGPKDIPPFKSKNQSALGTLFLGFLKYFATEFKWDRQMISVREAEALPKPSCREWKDKFICVEEPFDRSNTARAVHERAQFDAIKAVFLKSWQLLQQKKDLNSILPVRVTMQKC